ncbi:MAG: class I adenylate-forming enzyme family protein [Halioglobus sp.]
MSYQTLHSCACRHPEKTAVIYHDIAISYAALVNSIDTAITEFERQQLPEHCTVAVVVNNLLDCWILVFALQALGFTTVSARSLAVIDALELGGVTTLVTTDAERDTLNLEKPLTGSEGVFSIPTPSMHMDASAVVQPLRQNAKFGHHIVYTSGTTGNYKKILWGGPLQLQRNAERAQLYPLGGSETVYHGTDFGLWTAAGFRTPLVVWHLGGCVIFDQRPQWPVFFLQSPVTHTTLIPDKLHQLLDYVRGSAAAERAGDFELMATGGFVSRALAQEILHRLTRKLINAYGSTEMNVRVMETAVDNLDELHWMIPSPARTVEVVDDAGNQTPVGAEGQLRVRCDELDCSFYLDDDYNTHRVFRDGYFYPGDMAVRRADGRIRVLGRSADVINIRGIKHAVAPFEEAIQQRLGVDGVCLFSGIGAVGEEFVVIALEAAQWPEKSALDGVGREFSQFEQVRFAWFQRFPRTQSGTSKTDRIALRKLVFPGEDSATE